MTKRRKTIKRTAMEHVDIRASPESIARWKDLAEQSGMTLSQWLRRVADDGVVYQTAKKATASPAETP